MELRDLPHHEIFRCLACFGPAELPSFLFFKDVSLHSLKDHMVALESAVQDSTLLPTTLTMLRCKLCPAGTESFFLVEEELKTHLGNYHSDFFAKRWKKFSELQCRVCCEIVSDQDLFEDHMSRAHPRSLFADSDEVIDLKGPNLVVTDASKEYKKDPSDFKEILICKVEDDCSTFENQIDVKAEEVISSSKPTKQPPGLYLKPTDHLLDQSKEQPSDGDAAKKLATDRPFRRMSSLGNLQKVNGGTLWTNMRGSASTVNPRILRTIELKLNQLFLMGIKKTVSAEEIKNYFYINGVQVAEVFTRGGFGHVTFVKVEDAEAWTGKVIEIDDCCIRTNHHEINSNVVEENELLFNRIPKVISLDDLYKFFSRHGVGIRHIYLRQNGTGRIVFRNRNDAEFWKHNPDDLIVKGIKINVLRRPIVWKGRKDLPDQSRSKRKRKESRPGHYFKKESSRSRGISLSSSRSEHRDRRERQRSRDRSRGRSRERIGSSERISSRYRKRDRSLSWTERMKLCRKQ